MTFMQKRRLANILKVARFISENPDTWLREISRGLSMSPGRVSSHLKDLGPFLERKDLVPAGTSLPNLPVLLNLKPGVDEKVIIRGLKLRKALRE